MPVTTRAVSYDISGFTGAEFPVGGALLVITPSRSSVVDDHIIPAHPVTFLPDASGVGVANLVISADGDPQFSYSAAVVVQGDAGASSPFYRYEIGSFDVPSGAGGLDLSDLLIAGITPATTSYWLEVTEAEYDAFLEAAEDAVASAAAAGVASGRFVITAFAELATKFVDADPAVGQQILPVGGIVVDEKTGNRWERVTTGEILDYTGTGGVKFSLPTNQTITLSHFGAVEEPLGTFGGADQSARIQAFFDFINNNDCLDIDWSGAYSINNAVTLGVSTQVKSRNIRGRLHLRAMRDLPRSAFRVDNTAPDATFGDLFVVCFGGFDISVRKTPVAIEIGQFSRASVGIWQGKDALLWGVWCTTSPGVKNSNLTQAEKLSGIQCGSGVPGSATQSGTIDAQINYGTAGSTSQATRVSLGSFSHVPPASLAQFGIESTTNPDAAGYATNDPNPVFVRVPSLGNRLFQVIFMDRAGAAVWVYPRMPTVSAGTAFDWVYGGGVGALGGDSNIWNVKYIEASNCGTGFWCGALYGWNVGTLHTDSVGISCVLGGSTGNSSLGTTIGQMYVEGATHHLVTTSLDLDFEIGSTIALDLAFVATTVNPSDAAGASSNQYAALQKGRVGTPAGVVRKVGSPRNIGDASAFTWAPDVAGSVRVVRADSVTITLSLQAGLNDATGVDSGLITIVGTGAAGTPSGTITIQPQTGWKINGGSVDAAEVRSGLSGGPLRLTLYAEFASSNWVIA